MNKRHVLLGLIVVVFITTVTMVIMSGNMASLQVRAYGFFHQQRSTSATALATRNSTELTQTRRPSNSLTNTSSILTQTRRPSNSLTNTSSILKHPNHTQAVTPAPKNPPPAAQKAAQPVTNRPLKCEHCFQPSLSSLTTIPEVCAGSNTPEMLMMITTTLDGLERRQAIRETWASVTKENTAQVRHLFLLGTDKEGKVNKEILTECARYKDILVSNFVDTYGNLTYKTLAGMHYLVEHCAGAKFFLKTDQDMYVFVDRILNLAKKNEQTLQTSLGGSCYQSGKPWRNPKTKYYASIQSYPQNTYPGFCSGTGYIGSLNVARKIVQLSPNIPFFHLEDVYLALVLRQAGFKLTKYPGFVEGSGICGMRSSNRAKNAMTIHEVTAQKIREMWAKKCGV